jgi:hypothetical protein
MSGNNRKTPSNTIKNPDDWTTGKADDRCANAAKAG